MYGGVTDDPYKPPAKLLRGGKPKWSYAFRDCSGRVHLLRTLLWIGAGVALVAVVSGLMDIDLLSEMIAGRSVSAAEANASEFRQGLLSVTGFILFLATFVVFLMWLHRTSSNARTLATGPMRFTPGWSVGWFFVPIMNFWRPLQVMKELWRVSQEGTKYPRPTGVVVVWWLLWLAAGILSRIGGRMMLQAMRGPEESMVVKLQFASSIDLVSQVVRVASCIMSVVLVSGVFRMQLETLARRRAGAEEDLAVESEGERDPGGG